MSTDLGDVNHILFLITILVILKMRILDLVIMSRMGREKPDSNVTCMDLCRIDDLWCRVGTDSGGVVSLVDHPWRSIRLVDISFRRTIVEVGTEIQGSASSADDHHSALTCSSFLPVLRPTRHHRRPTSAARCTPRQIVADPSATSSRSVTSACARNLLRSAAFSSGFSTTFLGTSCRDFFPAVGCPSAVSWSLLGAGGTCLSFSTYHFRCTSSSHFCFRNSADRKSVWPLYWRVLRHQRYLGCVQSRQYSMC